MNIIEYYHHIIILKYWIYCILYRVQCLCIFSMHFNVVSDKRQQIYAVKCHLRAGLSVIQTLCHYKQCVWKHDLLEKYNVFQNYFLVYQKYVFLRNSGIGTRIKASINVSFNLPQICHLIYSFLEALGEAMPYI